MDLDVEGKHPCCMVNHEIAPEVVHPSTNPSTIAAKKVVTMIHPWTDMSPPWEHTATSVHCLTTDSLLPVAKLAARSHTASSASTALHVLQVLDPELVECQGSQNQHSEFSAVHTSPVTLWEMVASMGVPEVGLVLQPA